MSNNNNSNHAAKLREKAEERAASTRPVWSGDMSPEQVQKVIHELQVNQVELEIQNEELRAAQLAVEQSRARYFTLFDLAPVGYITLDRNGIVTEANLTSAQQLNVERERLLNTPFLIYVAEDHRSFFFQHLKETFETGKRQSMELHLEKRDGTKFYANLESVQVGQMCHTSISDMTRRKEAEDEANRLNRELKARGIQLETANRDLELFSYSVAHDLLAPLRSIDGFSQALWEDYEKNLDDSARDYIKRIRASAQKMGKLIDGLLFLSQMARRSMAKRLVNLSQMVRLTVDGLSKSNMERQISLSVADNVVACGDYEMLQSVIDNLIGNAWKFTSKTPEARIEFGKAETGSEKLYYIRDNGAGFNPLYGDKLFKPFQRLHREVDFSGIGIGLATAQRIIYKHGGRIWAEGKPGTGATFYFTLGPDDAGNKCP